jgi:hypothetical protein
MKLKILLKFFTILVFLFFIIVAGSFQIYNMYLGGKYPQKLSIDKTGYLTIEASKIDNYGISINLPNLCSQKAEYLTTDIRNIGIEHINNTSTYNIFFKAKTVNKKVIVKYLTKGRKNICIWKEHSVNIDYLFFDSYFSINKDYFNQINNNINIKSFFLNNRKDITVIPTLSNDYIFKIKSKDNLLKDYLFYENKKIADINYKNSRK